MMMKAIVDIVTSTSRGPILRTGYTSTLWYCCPKRVDGFSQQVSSFFLLDHATPPSTAWMATAFHITSETLRYHNQWLSYSKWYDLVKEHYLFCNGNEDKAEELKFTLTNLGVCAINQKEMEQEDHRQNRMRLDRTTTTRPQKTKKEVAEEPSLPGASINPWKHTSLKNFKKWCRSAIFLPTRKRKASSKAGRGSRKVFCRYYGSEDGLTSQSLIDMKSSKNMMQGLPWMKKAWKLCLGIMS
jgi:hypothetical protein